MTNNKKRAVFLDRDGVILVDKDLMYKKEDLELISRVAEAVHKLNENDYLAIVITNQPVIARGLCTIAELEEINKHLESMLQEQGARIDKTYYCPHHPDPKKGKIGPNGPNQEYAKECECRKPKPGLILQARDEFDIDLTQSYMIGDSHSDILAGQKAGCKGILVERAIPEKFNDSNPDFRAKDLYEAVRDIILKK